MKDNLRVLLTELQAEFAELGDPMEAPARPAELRKLRDECEARFSYTLPSAYLELLGLHDGLACNGIQLYASEAVVEPTESGRPKYLKRGLVEANEVWRDFEPNRDYIVFAESGSDLYQHNLAANRFEVADRVGRTVFNSFATAEELFELLFNHMLDRYGVEENEA